MSPQRWLLVLTGAAISILLYLALIELTPKLNSAEPSYAGQVLPWVELLTTKTAQGYLRQPDRGVLQLPSAQFLILLVGLFTLHGLTLRAVAGRRSSLLEVVLLVFGVIFLLLQIFGAAMLSGDLFSYVMYGRISGLYGGNAYVDVPNSFEGDPYLEHVFWDDIPSYYGPLWTLISVVLASIGGEQMGLTILLFRSAAIVGAVVAGGLILACLHRLAPERAAQGLVFFLWNPLVVLETGLSGHNDVVMVALLVLGLWLHLRGWRALAVVALTLSTLVKYVTGLVVPLYVLLVLRELPDWPQRRRFLALGLLAAAAVLALVLGQARVGPQVVAVGALGSSVERYSNNIHELVLNELRLWLGEKPASVAGPMVWERRPPKQAVQANAWLRIVAGLAFAVVWLLMAARTSSLRRLLVSSVMIMLASYWLLGAWIWPWYVIWAIGLAALVPTTRPAGLAAILSATVLSLYASFDFAGSEQGVWLFTYRSLFAFVLPLALFGLAILLPRTFQAAKSSTVSPRSIR